METKKEKVFLMFYPIDWMRHVFDDFSHTETVGIVGKVQELKRDYPNHADDIKIIPWGEVESGRWIDEAEYDADCFNDWDDMADEELIAENLLRIKGTGLTEDYIKAHWCVAVTEDVNAVLSLLT